MDIDNNDIYLDEKINILKRKPLSSREEMNLVDSYLYLIYQLKQNRDDKKLRANIELLEKYIFNI